MAKFITAYGTKQKTPTFFTQPTRTKQSHKDECDINNILARYKKTGVINFTNRHEPQYADVTGADYQEAQFIVARAKGLFAAMPAHLRARFDNEPGKFLAFVQDEKNREEAESLGLLKPKPEAAAEPAPAAAGGAAPAAAGAAATPPA